MPITVDTRVDKSVGKIISCADWEPNWVRSPITEMGSNCIDDAVITNNIFCAKVLLCSSKVFCASIPIGVATPPKPKRLDDRLSDIYFADFSSVLPKTDL